MKFRLTTIATCITLMSGTAAAEALITKTNASGFTFEPVVKTCKVYWQHVEVKTTKYLRDGEEVNVEVIPNFINPVRTLRALYFSFDESVINTPNYLCDGPSTTIKGNLFGTEIELFSTGGCGSDERDRTGRYSDYLESIVDEFCPVTHDFAEPPSQEVFYEFDFDSSDNGFVVDYSDYSLLTDSDSMQFENGWEVLPHPLNDESGLLVAGHNRSDDLFMFIKRQVSGLESNRTYQANLSVEFATNVQQNCQGIGGSPGSSVFVKAGAAQNEPKSYVEGDEVLFNLDKGNQSTSGENAVVIGNVENQETICDLNGEWQLKTLSTERPILVETDELGQAWIFAGTDSGFEGRSKFYYTNIKVRFSLLD